MLLRTAKCFLLFLLFDAKAAFGFSTDPRLIQLVPPQSHLVAGMSSSTAQGTTRSFLLISHENKVDLKDFYALTGGDASRRLKALVFVTAAGHVATANEHSLLVGGQFDRNSVFRFAAKGATRESYRGIPVLAVPPFQRERETFNEVRWLAIPDAHIAIFGSVQSVQRELDRWIERSAPDQILLGGLQRLKGHDDSWCVLLARDREGIAEEVLGKLDQKLGAVAHDGGLLGFGMKFGRKIEVAVVSEPLSARSWNSPNDLPGQQSSASMHFLPSAQSEGAGSEAAVKVSRRKYEEWIREFEHSDSLLGGAAMK